MKKEILLVCFLVINMYSSDLIDKNTNQNDIKRGFHFGEVENIPNKKEDEKSVKIILTEMLEIEKKQLKEQKRIRELLESQYDPQPKKFINKDGKECIENESEDCYKYPILPSASRTPVLAKFLEDPTSMENAINYKQWEDKHFSHVENIGYGMKYAVLNNNKKSKTMIDSSSMLSGRHSVYLTNAKADILKKHAENIKIFILMSNDGREFKSVRNGITEAIETLRFININPDLVFPSQEAVANFENIIKKYDSYILKELNDLAPNKIVSKKTLDAINPISYPTYLIKYNDKKEKNFIQVFGAGNSQGRDFINNLYEILTLNGVVDVNEINNSLLQEYELKNFKKSEENRK